MGELPPPTMIMHMQIPVIRHKRGGAVVVVRVGVVYRMMSCGERKQRVDLRELSCHHMQRRLLSVGAGLVISLSL